MAVTVLPLDKNGHPVQVVRLGETHTIDFGTTSTHTATAVQSGVVRLFATVEVSVVAGATSDVATAADTRLGAGAAEYFGVQPGKFIHAIGTGTGTLFITEG